MLLIDGAIAKVECKACGSIHKYRDIQQKTDKRTSRSSLSPARARREDMHARASEESGKKRLRNPAVHAASVSKTEQAWNEAMSRHSGENPLPYSMSGAYAQYALIEHSLFGKGEVISITPPDKMSVIFQKGVKVLRCKL
jgi:hypothetical protein